MSDLDIAAIRARARRYLKKPWDVGDTLSDLAADVILLSAENERIRTGHVCDASCAHTMCICERCGTGVRASRHPRLECDVIAKLRAERDALRAKVKRVVMTCGAAELAAFGTQGRGDGSLAVVQTRVVRYALRDEPARKAER